MPALDPESLARHFGDYGLRLSSVQLEQVQTYLELLLRWNRRLNLTGIRQPVRIVRELFCESMYLTRVAPLSGRLLDIGSGAGFPGLALKVAVPELDVTLVESRARKATFLREVCRQLHLSNVLVVEERFGRGSFAGCCFQYTTTRAVATTHELLVGVSEVLEIAGHFVVYSGPSSTREILKEGAGIRWLEPVPIPYSRQRVILVGQKVEV